eukprot:10753876-Heterocapsa_arctica.AAC.1
MEYGRPEERIQEKRTVMETVFFAEKRMQVSIIHGGNAEHSTNSRILATSNSCKTQRAKPTGMLLEHWSGHDRLDHLTRLGAHDDRGP